MTPRPEHDSFQPVRLGVPQVSEEDVVLFGREPLVGNPDAGMGMRFMQRGRHLPQPRQQNFRRRVTGIAARHKNMVNPRARLKQFAPSDQFFRSLLRIVDIRIDRHPHPDVQSIGRAQFAQFAVHLPRAVAHQLGARFVRFDGWNQLDGICPEHNQVAEILLVLREIPGVVTVRRLTVAELMAANRHVGSGGEPRFRRQFEFALRHGQQPQQPASCKKGRALIVSQQSDGRRRCGLVDPNCIGISALRTLQTIGQENVCRL